ncbi:MAG TPA: lipoyl(octanoyl) transferase LipB [Gemmatimonadaceae bacterium]|nr:lipoyl(octanoyl) transferase LipB [Gemmatimonadaceae bacterium]
MRQLLVVDLGRQAYADTLVFQREVARARIAGSVDEDVLLLVEHAPVITLGRSSKSAHMLATPEYLRQQGVELFEVERGGDVTFHGPGQLVGYPIIDLKQHKRDLHWYLRQVEEFLIKALATYELAGTRRAPYTGVWIDDRKIASIGVHARDWVTWHGFALNVTTDLRYFDLIVPCGIPAVRMTSIAAEKPNEPVELTDVAQRVVAAVADVFALTPHRTAPTDLAYAATGAGR